MYFEALASGGGSDWFYTIILKAPLGASITVDDGDEEVEALGTGNYIGIPVHNANSTYTITVEANGLTAPTQTVTTGSDSGGMSTPIDFNYAAIDVTYDEEFRGQTATITDGTHTGSIVIPGSPSTSVEIYVPYTGNWTISAVDPVSGNTFYTNPNPVVVSSLTQTINAILYVIPDGKIVTPTDDIELWLMCANIKDKNYTTLDEVLADEDCLFRLLTSDNANDYLKRSTTWAKAVDLVPQMIDSTHPSGVVTSSPSGQSGYEAYKAFDDNSTTVYATPSNTNSADIIYQFDSSKILNGFSICELPSSYSSSYARANTITASYSTDGTNYTPIGTFSVAAEEVFDKLKFKFDNSVTANYIKLNVTYDYTSGSGNSVHINEIEFYNVVNGITENELAMQIIGADDYATETLMDDATWKAAIKSSEYSGEVFKSLIPAMTDVTVPRGEVIADNNLTGSTGSIHVFDGDSSVFGSCGATDGTSYFGYDFKTPVKIEKIAGDIEKSTNTAWTCTVTFQYYDGTNWVDIQDVSTSGTGNSSAVSFTDVLCDVEATKFRALLKSGTASTRLQSFGIKVYGYGIGAVQTWLKAANIQKPYVTLDEVLADHDTLAALMANETAVDYLITDKSFIEDICADETAMKYIGKNNYAADALTSDSDWGNAIINSDYRDLIFNVSVPMMTSNTTPEGECGSTGGVASSSRLEFYAFDNNSSDGYVSNAVKTSILWYKFTSAKIIDRYRIFSVSGTTRNPKFKLVASNDITGPWTYLESDYNYGPKDNAMHAYKVNNSDAYLYYGLELVETATDQGNVACSILNFYGREDVSNTSIDIYSAANDDVIYYDSNNNPVTIATTDSTGHATVLKSNLPNGEYDLFSTVAKNPYDLASAYHKKVKVTDDTIDIYVMPDDSLYWYGFINNLENAITANGWSYSGGTLTAPTYDTNKMVFPSTSGQNASVGSSNPVDITSGINTILQNKTFASSEAGYVRTTTNKNLTGSPSIPTGNSSAIQKFSWTNSGTKRIALQSGAGRAMDVYALWHGHLEPTFISAANDTLYILDGATQIPVAYTDQNGMSFDQMLEPGTYDIYSSVAKDPENLSNPYHKQITITEYTRTVKVMPDNTIFWYGYTDEELTGGWARGYNASSTSTASWSDGYLYTALNSTNQTISVCSNNRIPIKPEFTKLCAVYENLYGTANTAMNIYLGNYGPGVIVSGGYADGPCIRKTATVTSKEFGYADVTSVVNSNMYMHGSSVTGNAHPAAAKTHALWFE